MPDQRYDASRKSLGVLLSATSPRIVVPEWQRSYSWGSEQVEQFWSDLTAFSDQYPGDNIKGQEYFLGSIVLVTGGPTMLLLDGQQRLATTTIMLAALRDARRTYNSDAASRLQSKYIKDFDDSTGRAEYVLTLNQYDRDFFRRMIQDEAVSGSVAPSLRSHALILRARDYLVARLAEGSARVGGGQEAFAWNLRLSQVLTDHMSVVSVESTDEDNAAAVFETLNDRGIGLSTPDLLRSYLLRKAPDDSSRERIGAAWQQVLGLSRDGVSVDQFLRHFWVSMRGDVKARSLYREIKARLEEESADAVDFSEKLASSAQVYRDLVRANYGSEVSKEALEGVAELGASVLYPLLLAAASVVEDDSKEFEQFVQFLVTTFVRYSVVAGRESTVLEGAVFAAAKQLRVDGEFAGAKMGLVALLPSLAEFRSQFERLSISRTATQRYVLRALEHHLRATEELRVASPSKVHVEHIYPQRPLPQAKLPGHTGVVNRLGNLTLLSKRLNIQIKNGDFASKKTKAYETSEIAITRALADEGDEWTTVQIDARQRQLAQYALVVWKFDDEDVTPLGEARDATAPALAVDGEIDPEQLPEIPDVAVQLED